MSSRVVTGVRGGTVVTNNLPCPGLPGIPSGAYAQSGVRQNETLQLVFPGTPPYNLTQTICDPRIGCWCGAGTLIDLQSNNYNWTVAGIKNNLPSAPGRPDVDVLFTPNSGQSIIWVAIEQKNTTALTSQYYISPNFTYSTTSFDNPASGGSLRVAGTGNLSMVGWSMVCLAVLGAIVGL